MLLVKVIHLFSHGEERNLIVTGLSTCSYDLAFICNKNVKLGRIVMLIHVVSPYIIPRLRGLLPYSSATQAHFKIKHRHILYIYIAAYMLNYF